MDNSFHVTTSIGFRNRADLLLSETLISKFIYSCETLKVNDFENYLIDSDYFIPSEGEQFLLSLKHRFEFCIKKLRTAWYVKSDFTACQLCSYGEPVIKFVYYEALSNERQYFFGFAIKKKNGILDKIQLCNFFDEYGTAEEFK
jgi:hypothetical protein